MRKNRFNILSLEEFDDSQVDGEVEQSSTPVADAIESENNAVELNNEVTAFEEHCEQQNEAIDTVKELQEQVDEQEEVLENNPEQVTEQTVEVAQEQFYITMNKITNLGYYGTSGTISHELSAGTPIERLKVSCEGIKDFISKVIDKILSFFKAIKDWFVKILQKIGLLKDENKKTAEIVQELPDVSDVNEATLEELIEQNKNANEDTIKEILGFYASNLNEVVSDVINGGLLDFSAGYMAIAIAQTESFKKQVEFLENKTKKLDENILKDATTSIIKPLKELSSLNDKIKIKPMKEFKNMLKGFDTVGITSMTHNQLMLTGIKKENESSVVIESESFDYDPSKYKYSAKNEVELVKYILTNKNTIQNKIMKTNTSLYNKYMSESGKLEKSLKELTNRLEKINSDYITSDLTESMIVKSYISLLLQFQKLANKFLTGSVLGMIDYTRINKKLYAKVLKLSKDAKFDKINKNIEKDSRQAKEKEYLNSNKDAARAKNAYDNASDKKKYDQTEFDENGNRK